MSVTVLTPAGTGAIATVQVAGPNAWAELRERFQPIGAKSLPSLPELHRVWFGTIGEGGDEVVVGVTQVEPQIVVEVHCHGGQRVVNWVVEQFGGAMNPEQPIRNPFDPHSLLPHASTLRTAAILLDQCHGAFRQAVEECLHDPAKLQRLAALAPLGRHLVEPWRVVLAGAPNAGKSSLINALVGYERSVVAPVAGTTRDVVTVRVALQGWPVELSDTAGLREAGGELEAEGIARTKQQLVRADLVVWVQDLTDPVLPPSGFGGIVVGNKADCVAEPSSDDPLIRVSALTGLGVPQLIGEIVRQLVPVEPRPGEAVPFASELAEQIEIAVHDPATAGEVLRGLLSRLHPSRQLFA